MKVLNRRIKKRNGLSNWLIVLAMMFSSCTSTNSGKREISIEHPTSLIELILSLTPEGLFYTVVDSAKTIVEQSALRLVVETDTLGLRVASISEPVHGEASGEMSVRGISQSSQYDHYQVAIPITDKSGRNYEIQAVVSELGAAFRWIIPGQGEQKVTAELSTFKLPEGSKTWYFERNNDWKLKSYAGVWSSASIEVMPTVSLQGPIQGSPLLFQKDDSYTLISEAALYNYSGMRLEAIGNNTFQTNLADQEGFTVKDTITTPWRVIIHTDNLNDLVNQNFIYSLNPAPSKALFSDQSYIKPGRTAWSWMAEGKDIGSYDIQKDYIQHTSQLGFEYYLIDEGWELWESKWEKTQLLIELAREKEVGIFVWKHSKEIVESTSDYQDMRSFLDSVAMTGAVGLKVDFMNAETKDKIDFEIKLLQEAAKRKLLINFHGCHKPTGESRTYPNELTREGIRGLELNLMKEGPITASHNAALPFTRFVVGHGDYTPMSFFCPGNTTYAHQLATWVLFTSPMQVMVENPKSFFEYAEIIKVQELVKEIPTVWDETRVLSPSKIGEVAAFARRSGDDWYLTAITGDEVTLDETIGLDFLDKDKEYEAMIVKSDGLTSFQMEKKQVSADEVLPLRLGTADGHVAWFHFSE